MSKIRYGLVGLTCLSMCLMMPMLSNAGEVILDAGFETEFVDQSIDVKFDNTTTEVDNILIKPFFSIIYESQSTTAIVRANHTYINRKLDGATQDNNYSEYNYSVDHTIVNNLLSITARGSKGFRSAATETYFIDDFLLNGDQLTEITFNQASANFALPRGDLFGLGIQAGYTERDVAPNENLPEQQQRGFQNKSYDVSFNAISGESLNNVRTTLGGQVNYTERDQNNNFISQLAQVANDIKVFGDFGLALNGTYENNEIKSDDETFDRLQEFYSVGAGLVWQPSNQRSIEVAYNRSITDSNVEGEENEKNNFLSLDVDWRFSSRTFLRANFSRRFFGDSADLLLQHSLRNWRTLVNYREQVTTNLQFISDEQQGLFVCENGSTDIADCTLSDNLNTPLESGQFSVPFVENVFEINDQVVLRKRLSLETAMTRRRTTISFTSAVSEESEIESNREFQTEQLGVNVSFNLGVNSTLKFSQTYSKTITTIDTGEENNSIARQSIISFTRKLSRRLSGSFEFHFLNRDGVFNNANVIRGINGPLNDRRFTLSIKYNYGNRR